MSLVIDIIIILAAVASIYCGIIRGFVRSASGFVSLILAVTAAFMFTTPTAEYLNEKIFAKRVESIVSGSLTGIVSAGEQKLALSQIIADRPAALDSVADRFGFDLDEIASYYEDALSGETDSEAIAKLSAYIAEPTARSISRVAASALVFVGALILLRMLFWLLDLICRLPVLDKLNTLLGLLFGIASAVVFSWSIANISVGLIRALVAIDSGIFNQSVIDGSVILKFFYEKGFIIFK